MFTPTALSVAARTACLPVDTGASLEPSYALDTYSISTSDLDAITINRDPNGVDAFAPI